MVAAGSAGGGVRWRKSVAGAPPLADGELLAVPSCGPVVFTAQLRHLIADGAFPLDNGLSATSPS